MTPNESGSETGRDETGRGAGSGGATGAGSGTARKPRKSLVGTVRSAKMQKTITVDVIRLERHPKYHKYVRRRSSYHAHDERSEAREGDQVRIAETRPLSKTKRWRLVEIVDRSKSAASGEEGEQ